MLNIKFIVSCIQNLKKFNVLKVGQKCFEINRWNCVKNNFTLKEWYIITFTLEVESA
jgi:hypothetical protein